LNQKDHCSDKLKGAVEKDAIKIITFLCKSGRVNAKRITKYKRHYAGYYA